MLFKNLKSGQKFILSSATAHGEDVAYIYMKSYGRFVFEKQTLADPFTAFVLLDGCPVRIPDETEVIAVR